jgi:hypothetical protein
MTFRSSSWAATRLPTNEAVDDLFRSSRESNGRRFVSLKWLRKMKQAAGRPQDRMDLDNLPEA